MIQAMAFTFYAMALNFYAMAFIFYSRTANIHGIP
jgi:hypothetical protein